MARPLRRLYPIQRIARRRHRTWMVSMTLATLSMAVLGSAVVWMKLAPSSAPRPETAFLVASLFSWPGLLLGLLTVRARSSWLFFALVPLFANGMVIVLPWLVLQLRS